MELCGHKDTNKKPDQSSGQASCPRNSIRRTVVCPAAPCCSKYSRNSGILQVNYYKKLVETVAVTCDDALVAQSIEQLHAKGQVVGANPTEGVSVYKRGSYAVRKTDERTVWSGILAAVPNGKPLFTRTSVRSIHSRPDLTSGRTLCVTTTVAVLIGGEQ